MTKAAAAQTSHSRVLVCWSNKARTNTSDAYHRFPQAQPISAIESTQVLHIPTCAPCTAPSSNTLTLLCLICRPQYSTESPATNGLLGNTSVSCEFFQRPPSTPLRRYAATVMSPTETLAQHQQTGLSNSSTSSSAERYRLDEFDTRPILLYKYRGGLQTSSQKDLCAWLDKDENLRVTKKAIPRYTSYVDVKRHDLYLPKEKGLYANYANYDSNLASIKVPSQAYWSRLFLGNYEELYIVSPESSPSSSQVDEGSRRTSPTSTWENENLDGAQLGASQESQNEE